MSEQEGKVLGDNAGVYIPSDEEGAGRELPIDFGSFIVGLYQSALMSMGQLSLDGEPGDEPVDLESARHTIALLKVLEQKTKGNLEPEEERLLSNLLYELRVKYVAVTR